MNVETETIIGVISAGVALLSLVVAYIADRRAKRTSVQAAQLSFQTRKNEIGLEVTKQLAAEQVRIEQVRRKIEEFEQVAEEVEALGVQELSDHVRELKGDIRQEYHEKVESIELTPVLQEVYEELDKLSPERATSESLRRLEVAKGKVQQMTVKAQQMDTSLASLISVLNESIDYYHGLVEYYRDSTVDYDSPEELPEGTP